MFGYETFKMKYYILSQIFYKKIGCVFRTFVLILNLLVMSEKLLDFFWMCNLIF